MAVCTAVVALFSSLDVLSNLVSIRTLFIFMLMSIALLVRRHYVSEKMSRRHAMLLTVFVVVIICSSGVSTSYWAMSSGWVGYCVSVPVWFLAMMGLSMFVLQCRVAKVWGVPLVPWVPLLSIAINLFLMGSLDYMSFIRFGISTVIMLVYYVFLGLHASFDVSHVVGVGVT